MEKNWEFSHPAKYVIGVDEVGVGPIAGPMVACAVVLNSTPIPELNDSKKLTHKQTSLIISRLPISAIWHTSWGSVFDVNMSGPKLRFSLMANSVSKLISRLGIQIKDTVIVVDGDTALDLDIPQIALPKADSLCREVAASSVIAKYLLDTYMAELHKLHPQYDWYKNKGYPTEAHLAAVSKFGPSEHHRKSYTTNAMVRYEAKLYGPSG